MEGNRLTVTLRVLQIHATTDRGNFGRRLDFRPGLNVLRAENSAGKSTCLNAIAFALGLEGAFSPRHESPLPRAVTEVLEHDGKEIPIRESHVTLELTNARGKTITVRRFVTSPSVARSLIRVWDGSYLTGGPEVKGPRDYFVRMEGAATREAGFHTFLASFFDWELPKVVKFDGDEVPLYMEYLWPFFFVEQKKGWSEIVGHVPTYLGVKEGFLRAFEFLLSLDTNRILVERQRLEIEARAIIDEWGRQRSALLTIARTHNGMLKGVPAQLGANTDPQALDSAILLVPEGTQWRDMTDLVEGLRAQVLALREVAVPTSGDDSVRLNTELESARGELAAYEIAQREIQDKLGAEQEQTRALEERLRSLREDLQRHKDLERLQRLGSPEAHSLDTSRCPVCHQTLPETLIPVTTLEEAPTIMTVSENTQFLEAQVKSFAGFQASSGRLTQAYALKLEALSRKATEARLRIRIIKETLTTPSAQPSAAEIRRRVLLEEQIGAFVRAKEAFGHALTVLQATVNRWQDHLRRAAEMPRSHLSDGDEQKLNELQQVMVEEFREYGVGSVPSDAISLSHTSYRPEYETFALTVELSASDTARLIWAYLLGILEVGLRNDTNHLGLLLLDEPRQHHAAIEGYTAFLRRAAANAAHGAQVIVATSEDEVKMREVLRGIPHTWHSFGGRAMAPIP